MAFKTIQDVLYHGLKDLLSAEKQFRNALPKLAEATTDSELAQAFDEHRLETEEQIARLEECFESLGRPERSEKCAAADGLTSEGEDIIDEGGEGPALDIMLATAGRKTEAYEIASYEDAIACAKSMEADRIVELLQSTLDEERAASTKLAQISARLQKDAMVAA